MYSYLGFCIHNPEASAALTSTALGPEKELCADFLGLGFMVWAGPSLRKLKLRECFGKKGQAHTA